MVYNHCVNQENKYIMHTRISERTFLEVLKLYSIDETACKASIVVNLNKNTVRRIFELLRVRLAELAIQESIIELSGGFEVDESYFGVRRVRGKRSGGAGGKIPVFRLLKRNQKVYILKSSKK